jgi:hypothetical protein
MSYWGNLTDWGRPVVAREYARLKQEEGNPETTDKNVLSDFRKTCRDRALAYWERLKNA